MIKLFILFFIIVLPPAAFAALVDSKHDFSYLGNSPCSYCHSVHHSIGGFLRPAYMGTEPQISKVYSSVTMRHKPTTAGAYASDAPLCLTCHDGMNVGKLGNTTLTALIVNKPADLNKDGDATGSNLSNDHPVGFIYDPTLSPDKLKYPEKAHANFGAGHNEIWCCSCHNPHNDKLGAFLNVSMAGSELCFDCHKK